MQDNTQASESTPLVVQPVAPTIVNKQRHFLAVFFLSFMWGTFGVDRFYLGKIWTGILKLVTFGGFGLWTIIDLSRIMSGTMRDKQGNEMLEVKRYKKFASRTVLWFAIIVGLVVLSNIVLGILGVVSLMDSFKSGGNIQDLIPSGLMPDTTQLQDVLNPQQSL